MIQNIIHNTSLKWDPSNLLFTILDQRLLPFEEKWVDLNTEEDCFFAIQDMLVRGAPLIGVTAAYGFAISIKNHVQNLQDQKGNTNCFQLKVLAQKSHDYLATSRPTAVNLQWALSKQLQNFKLALDEQCTINETKSQPETILNPSSTSQKVCSLTVDQTAKIIQSLFDAANTIREEDIESCRQIGLHGAKLIEELYQNLQRPIRILTHCNAGALACVEWGTATSPIYHAHNAGIPIEVLVDETRPRNQGASLTAWEMSKRGIPHFLLADNAGGHLMQHNQVDIVIVGSDRTTRTGDVANKIGTYLKALAADANQIPFYAALPSSTIDWTISDGVLEIPIEERSGDEVTHIRGLHPTHGILDLRVCTKDTNALNPAFDVTPAHLVTGIITEKGIAEANESSIAKLFPELS